MNRNNAWVLLLLIVLNILLTFYQPFSKNFTVDEGQYLLIAKKMLDGWVPYRDIVNDKPLGLYLSLIPAVLLGGKDIVRLRLYGALIGSLTPLLIFLIGERLKNRWAGLISAFAYMLIGIFPGFGGYLFITEPIANLFLVASFYILLFRKKTYSNFFLVGALATIACSIRQTCIFVFIPIIFGFICYGKRTDRKKTIAAFLMGMGVIAIPMLLYLTLNSALWDAVYWCVYAPIRFGRGFGLEDKVETFGSFLSFFYPLILFAVVTLWDMTRERKLLWLWLLSAFLMAQVSYSLLHNYLVLGPPLSILAAIGGAELYERSRGKSRFANVYRGILIFLSASTILLIFFELYTIAAIWKTKDIYGEQWAVSEYISSHTSKDDGIFVFMDDPFIYYISEREPVTKMTFFWIEFLHYANDSEKNEYIFAPLEKSKPKYFVMEPLIYGNDSSVLPVRRYLDENYTHVNDWGIFQLYERKPD
jgi:4-amino-4-deoxy-L-arabinose transferase-like glycosyltransferase